MLEKSQQSKNNLLQVLPYAMILAFIWVLSGCSTNGFETEPGKLQNLRSKQAPQLAAAYKAYEEGRLSSAETLLLQYTQKHPNFTDAWFKLGNIYYRTGQYPAAITAYENVIQQQPKYGKAWYNLALTRIRQAEVILEKGESQFNAGDRQRLKLTSLKHKIRSGVRQYKPVSKSKQSPVAKTGPNGNKRTK